MSADAFEVMEKSLLGYLEAWSKGSFTASRAIYGENDALCIAIESAIWVSFCSFCSIK